MGEGWEEGSPLPFVPSSPRRRLYEPEATRGGEISIFLDVQLSVCKFLMMELNRESLRREIKGYYL
jgi:hypothetical protein